MRPGDAVARWEVAQDVHKAGGAAANLPAAGRMLFALVLVEDGSEVVSRVCESIAILPGKVRSGDCAPGKGCGCWLFRRKRRRGRAGSLHGASGLSCTAWRRCAIGWTCY